MPEWCWTTIQETPVALLSALETREPAPSARVLPSQEWASAPAPPPGSAPDSAERTRAPRDGGPQDESGLRKTDQGPQDVPGPPKEQLGSPHDESKPHVTDQCPQGGSMDPTQHILIQFYFIFASEFGPLPKK